MKFRTRLALTWLEDRANPSGLDDGTGYTPPPFPFPPYDPGSVPPSQSSPTPTTPPTTGPTPTVPTVPPYGAVPLDPNP
jgi:hypothetical protein